jgi:hypothetical protein
VGPSTDCNPETTAKYRETVARECRMTLKEIQNTVQILFDDVTNCKIWAKLVIVSWISNTSAEGSVLPHPSDNSATSVTVNYSWVFNTITKQNVRV